MAESSVGSVGGGGFDSYGSLHRPFVNPGNIESLITQNTAGFDIHNRPIGFSLQAMTSSVPAMTAVKPLHAKPYDVLVAVAVNLGVVSGGHQAYGLCLRESSSGKLVTFGSSNELWGNVTGIAHWTDAGTPVSHSDFSLPFSLVNMLFFRITDDGTTRKATVSYAGLEFFDAVSEPSGTWCEPDQIGFIFQCEKAAGNKMIQQALSLEIVT